MTATAHVFDAFAPQLGAKGHVYGVTRRGWGASDKPDPAAGGDYTTERLGKDALAVIDALHLDKPVLVGWSYGGAEMSYVASRAPGKVSGLVYLEGGYAYAFYAPGNYEPRGANLTMDASDLRAKIARALAAQSSDEAAAIIRDLLETNLPQLEADLHAADQVLREDPNVWPRPAPQSLQDRVAAAVAAGYMKLPAPKVPVLAIFADPSFMFPGMTPAEQESYRRSQARASEVVNRFEAGNPGARIVRLPNARHAIFMFAGPDVLREMNAFFDGLD
jgi:pimeloyl-ACP methyl ester carboxylesterase